MYVHTWLQHKYNMEQLEDNMLFLLLLCKWGFFYFETFNLNDELRVVWYSSYLLFDTTIRSPLIWFRSYICGFVRSCVWLIQQQLSNIPLVFYYFYANVSNGKLHFWSSTFHLNDYFWSPTITVFCNFSPKNIVNFLEQWPKTLK